MKSKILYTVGDSWTYGDDLKNPQIESYPYLLSKRIGCDLVNDGKNFAGNDWIFRKSVEFITSNKIENIHTFIVGWSNHCRREENFKFFYGGSPEIEGAFRARDSQYDLVKEKVGNLNRVVLKNKLLGDDDETSKMISELLYNEELSIIKTLTYIVSLQELLKSKNINYVFFFPWYDVLIEKNNINDIYLNIDTDYCIGPTIDDDKIPTDDARHPNKKEHKWMANKLYQFIGDKYGF